MGPLQLLSLLIRWLVSLIEGEDEVDEGVVDTLALLLVVCDDEAAGVLVVLGESDAPLIGVPGELLLVLLLVIMVVDEAELVVVVLDDDAFVLFAASEAISTENEEKRENYYKLINKLSCKCDINSNIVKLKFIIS